jgi:hypothetical protein
LLRHRWGQVHLRLVCIVYCVDYRGI